MVSRQCVSRAVTLAVLAGTAGVASADIVRAIYTKINGHPTAVVPGALNGSGAPTFTEFRALEDLVVRADGQEWVLKGRTQLTPDQETILIKGSGLTGTMFLQEDQPVLGGLAGEKYDFFDTVTPVSWDSAGNMGFSLRSKGGATAVAEKLIKVVGGVHTVVLNQGSPFPGLTDVAANPTGDELVGNSIGSVQLLDSGSFFFGNTPITNCHSSRYPALFKDGSAFKQSGVSVIGAGEIWDNFVFDGCGMTPDGAHWFARGDTENPNTTIDNIFVVDNAIVFTEGSPIAGPGSPVYADTFNARILPNGDWYARGDDPADNDWAVRNGVILAKTGDQIVTGHPNTYGVAFASFTGNANRQWVLATTLNNATPADDDAIVLNGRKIVVREGDPVDLNGDGIANDDAFIGRGVNTNASFIPNTLNLTDDLKLYFLCNIRNSAGVDLNGVPSFGTPNAFVYVQLYCPSDFNQDGFTDAIDYDLFITDWLATAAGADYNTDGFTDAIDYDLFIADWLSGC